MSSEPFTLRGELPAETASRDNSPDETDIRSALAKVLGSDPFIRSERIKKLLRFLVESVIARNEGFLKETLIGMEVFDREPGYDSKQDAVVRVEMRRLRSKLAEYYLDEGRDADVLIRLEKGSYVPAFTWQTSKPPAAPDPSLAFARLAPEPLAPLAADGASQTVAKVGTANVPSQRRTRRHYLLGFAVLAMVLAIVVLIFATRPKTNLPASHRLFPLTGNAGIETSPVFSPDSKQVAFSWNGSRNNFNIYVKSLDAPTVHRLTNNPAHDIDPAWSPRGEQIAFLRISPSKTQLVTIPSTSGVERVIAELDRGVAPWGPAAPVNNGTVGPVWSHDGTFIVMTSSKEKAPGLRRIGLDGRERVLTQAPYGAQDFAPKISPSGKAIAFQRMWGAASSDLFVISIQGTQLLRLTFDSHDIEGVDWLDDHNLVYSSNRGGNFRLWQISTSGGSSQIFPAGGSQPQYPSLSPDGRWLAFVEPSIRASLWRLELNAAAPKPEPFISSAGQDYSGTYSPDGKKIVYVSDRSGSQQIWVSETDGANATQVTHFKGSSVGSPQWSPDSGRICFDGLVDGLSSIWIVDADGSDLRRLNNQQVRQYLPTWSRDGQWIYFASLGNDKKDHLWKQNPDSGESIELTHEPFYDALDSADRQTLYMERFQGGIWQMPLEGGTPSPIPELVGIIPHRYWTLSNNTIYFVRGSEGSPALQAFDLVTRRFRTLAAVPAPIFRGVRGISVSPQQNAIAFTVEDQRRSSVMLEER